MRKIDLIRKNMVESVRNERNILAMANNPFVVGFTAPLFALHDEFCIYVRMLAPMPGGELACRAAL